MTTAFPRSLNSRQLLHPALDLTLVDNVGPAAVLCEIELRRKRHDGGNAAALGSGFRRAAVVLHGTDDLLRLPRRKHCAAAHAQHQFCALFAGDKDIGGVGRTGGVLFHRLCDGDVHVAGAAHQAGEGALHLPTPCGNAGEHGAEKGIDGTACCRCCLGFQMHVPHHVLHVALHLAALGAELCGDIAHVVSGFLLLVFQRHPVLRHGVQFRIRSAGERLQCRRVLLAAVRHGRQHIAESLDSGGTLLQQFQIVVVLCPVGVLALQITDDLAGRSRLNLPDRIPQLVLALDALVGRVPCLVVCLTQIIQLVIVGRNGVLCTGSALFLCAEYLRGLFRCRYELAAASGGVHQRLPQIFDGVGIQSGDLALLRQVGVCRRKLLLGLGNGVQRLLALLDQFIIAVVVGAVKVGIEIIVYRFRHMVELGL